MSDTDPNEQALAAAVAAIAEKLGETKKRPLTALLELTRSMGVAWVLETLQQAAEQQALGRLKRYNGKPRTPGGAFFKYAKKRLTYDEYLKMVPSQVLENEKKRAKQRALKKKRYKANLKKRKAEAEAALAAQQLQPQQQASA